MPQQLNAITGRRVKPQYAAMVRGQSGLAPAIYNASEARKNSDQARMQEIAAFEASKAEGNRNYALAKKSAKNSREMNRYATIINVANLLANMGKSNGGSAKQSADGAAGSFGIASAADGPAQAQDTTEMLTSLPGGTTGQNVFNGVGRTINSAQRGDIVGMTHGVNTTLGNPLGGPSSPVSNTVNMAGEYGKKANQMLGPFAAPVGAVYGGVKGFGKDVASVLGYNKSTPEQDRGLDAPNFTLPASLKNAIKGTSQIAKSTLNPSMLSPGGIAIGLDNVFNGKLGSPNSPVDDTIGMARSAAKDWSGWSGPFAPMAVTMNTIGGLGKDFIADPINAAVRGVTGTDYGQISAIDNELQGFFGDLDAYEQSLSNGGFDNGYNGVDSMGSITGSSFGGPGYDVGGDGSSVQGGSESYGDFGSGGW